jgi:hypothetical protein
VVALSEAKKQEVRDLWASGQFVSHRALAKSLKLDHTTVDKILGHASDSPSQDAKVLTETSEIIGEKWNISLPKTRICTLEELIAFCKVDTTIWKVERWTANKWEVGAKNDEGNVETAPLYQVKATFIRQQNIVDAKLELETLKTDAKKAARTPAKLPVHFKDTGLMLEISLADAHFGKLAWSQETGHEPYDTMIAEAIFTRAVDTLLSRAKGYKFDHILFVVGNDLLNSDDELGRTTKGTFVSTDVRYQKTFLIVRRTITACIEKMRLMAPVHVLMVSGNHDDLAVWSLGDSLSCYFDKYPDVFIDNAPISRKYHQFGKVMLLLTHGDKGKHKSYPLLMATEQPEMFGSTMFREAHTGHTHQTKTEEQFGVRVRVIPSLSPPDAWHAENNFLCNQRNAEAYVWSAKEGLIAQFYHNDDAYPPVITKRVIVATETPTESSK